MRLRRSHLGIGPWLAGPVLASLCALPVPAAARQPADNWPVFRGNPLETGVASSGLPDRLEVRWKFQAKDSIEGAAAVVDHTVYVGSMDEHLYAVELATGAVKWSEDRFHAGTVTLAGDRLLILRETGELILAAATPEAFRPLARAQILPATVRANLALADGFLYARNSDTRDNMLVCVDLQEVRK